MAGKVIATFRKTVKSHLQGGIFTQGIAVITVLIAADDLDDTPGEQVLDCPVGRVY